MVLKIEGLWYYVMWQIIVIDVISVSVSEMFKPLQNSVSFIESIIFSQKRVGGKEDLRLISSIYFI